MGNACTAGDGPSNGDKGLPYGVWEEAGVEDAKFRVSPILRANNFNKKEGTNGFVLEHPVGGGRTLWEMAEYGCKENADKKTAGVRRLLKREFVEGDGGKKFEKLTLSPEYEWMTFREYGEYVAELASGMVSITGLKKGDRVLIFAETQRDWMTTAIACWRQGAAIVTVYATLGEEGVSTALTQTDAKICVCDSKLFGILKKAAQKPSKLKHVFPILTDLDDPNELLKDLPPGIEAKPLKQVVQQGKSAVCAATPPDPQDEAVIMYTSGTTGNSKGVVITHQNVVAQSAGGNISMPEVNSETVYLCYLPLAHIMELFIEVHMVCVGATFGYGSPHTLTDTGVKLAEGQKGDAPLLAPTLMVFAPAVLDKVYNGVKKKVEGSGIKETLFYKALEMGEARYDQNQQGCGFLGNLIMKKVQSLIGGRVKYMVTGSAPLSPEIQRFVQNVFNCPVRQGYGLTETMAASCVGKFEDNTLRQNGPPTRNTFVRIRDWEEGNYLNSDAQNPEIRMRRGEVLIGGPTVASGYLIDSKDPDPELEKKNKEDFIMIEDIRYFCTGDIGQVTPDGTVMIIDRKKDLFKGENGEYVSLGKVEGVLKLCPYVEMPLAYGKTGARSIIALIMPQADRIKKLAQEKNLSGDYASLCKEKVVVAEVQKEIAALCKKNGLNASETPTGVALVTAPDGGPAWTPENDYLTSTMKLKRPVIARGFAEDISRAYGQ